MPYRVKLKISVYCLCQSVLNHKLLHKFGKWCKFSSCVKVKSHKKQSHETRLSCNVKLNKFLQLIHLKTIYQTINVNFSLIFHTGRLEVLGKFILMFFK